MPGILEGDIRIPRARQISPLSYCSTYRIIQAYRGLEESRAPTRNSRSKWTAITVFDEGPLPRELSGPSARALPLLLYSKLKPGASPDVHALASLNIATVAAAVLIADMVMRRAERQCRLDV